VAWCISGAQVTGSSKHWISEDVKEEIKEPEEPVSLDTAAADAVKNWRFDPARLGKEPVAVWVLLPVKFELR